MEKIILKGVELLFDDFTSEIQKKLYLKNKEEFQMDAAKSRYTNMRKLLIADEQTSSEVLEEIFNVETEMYGDVENLEMLWNHPNLKKMMKSVECLQSQII